MWIATVAELTLFLLSNSSENRGIYKSLNMLPCHLIRSKELFLIKDIHYFYKLLDYFDTDRDGCVNFDEFLVGIRGQLNEKRKDIVLKAFYKFDKDCSGTITTADLEGVYNVSFHPKFKSGEMTKEEIFVDFLKNFGDKNHDGVIVKEEWLDYYAAISSNIDDDDHFVLLMKTAWKLD